MKRKNSSSQIQLQKQIIRGILVIGALALVIIFLFGNHGLYQLYTLKKERDKIQQNINSLPPVKKKTIYLSRYSILNKHQGKGIGIFF